VEIDSRLEAIEAELADSETRLADPDVVSDHTRLEELARRHKELSELSAVGGALRDATADLDEARVLATEAGGDDAAEYRQMASELAAQVEDLTQKFRLLLVPADPDDDRNVIVEIRGAEGGEEANLFARDLHDMYIAYAKRIGWTVGQLNAQPSDMGGFTEVSLSFKGDGVWARLKHEGGPHRVQRVPATESQGRIHTSSATVTVLPEAEEVDIVVDENDLQIDVYRSSGPGGQSVNTTDSAVRITHKPTGVVVSMQDEKSQLQNKAKALRVLRARLYAAEQDRKRAELSESRRDQIGGGGRSEKIRTYNYKDNRVTDHRIGLTLHKLDRIIGGELDEITDALVREERERQLGLIDS
jgi:peptide chain release factor 1